MPVSQAIHLLPDHVVQQIAAGEVVERPASIVKELIENAIDAKATQISICIKEGGIGALEITDDGHGIDKDQLTLALTAHATSKLSSEDDLHHIATRGFRGEALASIAAISHLDLHSKPAQQEHGFCIRAQGGVLSDPQPSAIPNGTKIYIANLFYNTPARKKFLKSPNTEKNHILKQLKDIALLEYGIAFKILLDDGKSKKMLYHWPRQDTWLQRIADIFPGDTTDKLLPLQESNAQLHIEGYISNRHLSFSRSNDVYFYVNHRPVSDRTLQAALMEGYRTAMMEKRYPMAIIKIDIDPTWVDVNIHPRKNEVRFSAPQHIFQSLSFAVKQALAQQRPETGSLPLNPLPINRMTSQPYASAGKSSQGSNAASPMLLSHLFASSSSAHNIQGLKSPTRLHQPSGSFYAADASTQQTQDTFASLNFIGHIDHTYLLCSNHHHLFIIDQHAAHERILFDQYKQQSNLKHSQQLLTPITLQVNHEKAELLQNNLETLASLGFELENFGPDTFILRSTPVFLMKQDPRVCIDDMCSDLLQSSTKISSLEDRVDEICSSMACHSAVRAHDILSPKEVESLLRQMDQVDLASYCPHGRPTYIEYTVADFEKLFKRV